MKRVLIVTQYYYPENFRINELGSELSKRGYEVDALVGIPNYPEGKFYKGYGITKKRKEHHEGVNIYRVFQFPRGNASNFRLSLNYISYAIFASTWVLFYFAFKKKYDVIIGFQLSPITQVYPGILLKLLRKTKLITWVQDIWPDSITDNTSPKQNKILIPILSAVTEFVYKKSDKLLITSKGMQDLICRNCNYHFKIQYQPNWCIDFTSTSKHDVQKLPNGFNLMMAGNLGEGLGINDLIEFVKQLDKQKDLNVIFVGGGSKEIYLRAEFNKLGLSRAFVLGKYPYEDMPSMFAQADAMLLTLMKTSYKHLDVTIPSRLQSYMSAGKPVFAMVGGGAAEVIKRTDCGFVVPAGDAKGLANLVKTHYKDTDLLAKKGKNARLAYEREFTIERGIDHFEKLINEK